MPGYERLSLADYANRARIDRRVAQIPRLRQLVRGCGFLTGLPVWSTILTST